MRVLPIGLAIARSSGWLLVGVGLMVMVFASRQVDPWPRARVGSAIVGLGGGLLIAVRVRATAQRYRQCPSCERVLLAEAVQCPYCAVWSSVDSSAADP
jgi:hypothetical protein